MSTAKSTVKFPNVGIGASAGGLEALEQFFENTKDINLRDICEEYLLNIVHLSD